MHFSTYSCVISATNGSGLQCVKGTFHAFSGPAGILRTQKQIAVPQRILRIQCACVCVCGFTLMSSPCTVRLLQRMESGKQWQIVEVKESFFVLKKKQWALSIVYWLCHLYGPCPESHSLSFYSDCKVKGHLQKNFNLKGHLGLLVSLKKNIFVHVFMPPLC